MGLCSGFYYQKEVTTSVVRHNPITLSPWQESLVLVSLLSQDSVARVGLRHLNFPSAGAQGGCLRAEPLGIIQTLWTCVQVPVLEMDVKNYQIWKSIFECLSSWVHPL